MRIESLQTTHHYMGFASHQFFIVSSKITSSKAHVGCLYVSADCGGVKTSLNFCLHHSHITSYTPDYAALCRLRGRNTSAEAGLFHAGPTATASVGIQWHEAVKPASDFASANTDTQ